MPHPPRPPHHISLRIGVALVVCASVSVAAGARATQPLGDLSGDGDVSIADAARLWRIVGGVETASPEDSLAGDCSPRPGTEGRSVGDGVLDDDDVDRILDLLLGNVSNASFYGILEVQEVFPPAAAPGDTLDWLFVRGTSLLSVTSVFIEPSGDVALDSLLTISDSLLVARLVLGSGASAGVRSLRVATPAETSAAGPAAVFTVHPPGGPPLALTARPDTLRLVAGDLAGHIHLFVSKATTDSSDATAMSADTTVASTPPSYGASAEVSEVFLPVVPREVGSTTVTGAWLGLPYSVVVEVSPPNFTAAPDSFYLFQTGLTDSLILRLTAQREGRTILLESSDPMIASVPPEVDFAIGQEEALVEVVPGSSFGDAVITATLPAELGGGSVEIDVHVEKLTVSVYAAEDPLTLQDWFLGIGGLIFELNGASRDSQRVLLTAEPHPSGSGGFDALPYVDIPPNEVFWTDHVIGLPEGPNPPAFGTVTAKLALNPLDGSSLPVVISYGPPIREAMRLADSTITMVRSQRPRYMVVAADQSNGGGPPSWMYSVSGPAVAVTDTTRFDSPAALLLRLTPMAAGSSEIVVTCGPEGFTDTLVVNVLEPETELPSTAKPIAPRMPGQAGDQVVELDGLKVVGGQKVDFNVTLPGARNATGSVSIHVEPDRFNPPKPGEPDIGMGSSTDVRNPVQEIDLVAAGLDQGAAKPFSWGVRLDARDPKSEIARPGRYRIRTEVTPRPRDRGRGAGEGDGIARATTSKVVLNMGQVVYLRFAQGTTFQDDFEKGLTAFVLVQADASVNVRDSVVAMVGREFHALNAVNVVVTKTKPAFPALDKGFLFKTFEIGGTDPNGAALGRSRVDIGNRQPGASLTRDLGFGAFPGVLVSSFNKVFGGPVDHPEFLAVFAIKPILRRERDLRVHRDIFANLIASIAVHELAHAFGLTAGPDINDFLEENPPWGAGEWHNGGGRAKTAGGSFYMDSGKFHSFREMGMISRAGGVVPPFTIDQIGMKPPGKDFSMGLTPVNLKYMRRLLPRGMNVE